MKVNLKKISKGDKFLVWATVTSVYSDRGSPGRNDVTVKVENTASHPSTVSIELADCNIYKYLYRKVILGRVAEFIKKKIRLTKLEKTMLGDILGG